MRLLNTILLFFSLLAVLRPAQAISVSVQVTHNAACSYGGRIVGTITGGVPPFQVVLSSGGQTITSSTSFILEDVPAGANQVVVTDALLDEAVDDFDVVAYATLTPFSPAFAFPLPNCGQGTFPVLVMNFEGIYPSGTSVPGMPPLLFMGPSAQAPQTFPGCWNGSYLVEFTGASPGSSPTMTYTDANGCPGTIITNIPFPTTLPSVGFLDITGSCSNLQTGSITIGTYGGSLYECRISFRVYDASGNLVVATCGSFPSFSSLPASTTIAGLPAGDLVLRVQAEHILDGSGDWNSVPLTPVCIEDHPFTVPSVGPCARVAGTVFVDNNVSCNMEFNEPRVPDAVVEVMPGLQYTMTSSIGSYGLVLPTGGAFAMVVQHPAVEASCVTGPIPFNATLGSTTTLNVATASVVPLDVGLSIASGIARPGFQVQYGMLVENFTPSASGNTTVTMEFDPTLGYIGANPTPTSMIGNVITWSGSSLSGWAQRTYTVDFQVPPDVLLIGNELVTTAMVTTANTDGSLANNTAVNLRTITGALDPNDKIAVTSTGGTEHWAIGADEWIDYTIRFQNTGTDTAFHIVIRDTLAADLDPTTFQMGAASHNNSVSMHGNGTLRWTFPNIQLPDSNVNEAASHGFVSFRIRPRLPVLPGTVIENTANIYFDFNPPVITEPSVLVAEFSTSMSEHSGTIAGHRGWFPGDLRSDSFMGHVQSYQWPDHNWL